MKVLTTVQKMFPEVTHVRDAKKSLLIEVTKQDASSRAVRNHKECALAVACKRTFEVDGALIARSTAYLIKGKTATRYRTSVSAAREMVSFDRGAGFEPGEYYLSPVPPSAELGVRSKRSGSHNRTPSGKKKFSHHTTNIRASLLE